MRNKWDLESKTLSSGEINPNSRPVHPDQKFLRSKKTQINFFLHYQSQSCLSSFQVGQSRLPMNLVLPSDLVQVNDQSLLKSITEKSESNVEILTLTKFCVNLRSSSQILPRQYDRSLKKTIGTPITLSKDDQ
jgi:hypothetical protein